MKLKASITRSRLAIAFVAIALIVAAFLRGNHLLGLGIGIAYAITAAAVCWLWIRTGTRRKEGLTLSIFLGLFSALVACFMAFPATFNPDVQIGINRQAVDRNVRRELKAVFNSDHAFRALSTSSVHLKSVNITISGTLPTDGDLQRLRNRIMTECPTLRVCVLHWNVILRDEQERIVGLDRLLFSSAKATALNESH